MIEILFCRLKGNLWCGWEYCFGEELKGLRNATGSFVFRETRDGINENIPRGFEMHPCEAK